MTLKQKEEIVREFFGFTPEENLLWLKEDITIVTLCQDKNLIIPQDYNGFIELLHKLIEEHDSGR